MFVDFEVTNYKSIKDKAVLSFVAANLSELPANVRKIPMLGRKNAVEVFTAAGLYGANASGKSTVAEAVQCFAQFVCDSTAKYKDGDTLPFTPFLLNEAQTEQPSSFQSTFFINDILYVYGFSADSKTIHDEWLSYWPKGKERVLFKRKDGIYGADFKRHHDIRQATRTNALIVSTGATLNEETCKRVVQLFARVFSANSIINSSNKWLAGTDIDSENLEILSSMLQYADVGIQSIAIESIKDKNSNLDADIKFLNFINKNYANSHTGTLENLINNTDNESKDIIFKESKKIINILLKNFVDSKFISFHHKTFGTSKDANEYIRFTGLQESDGTIKYLLLLNTALNAFKNGGLIILDELDAKLHPLLAAGFLKFFQSTANTKAQLIFTTHATDLLDEHVLRRDQVYITEKNEFGESVVTNLSEYKVRKDAVLSKRYLEGRYGGVPYLHQGYLEQADAQLRHFLLPSATEGGK